MFSSLRSLENFLMLSFFWYKIMKPWLCHQCPPKDQGPFQAAYVVIEIDHKNRHKRNITAPIGQFCIYVDFLGYVAFLKMPHHAPLFSFTVRTTPFLKKSRVGQQPNLHFPPCKTYGAVIITITCALLQLWHFLAHEAASHCRLHFRTSFQVIELGAPSSTQLSISNLIST